MSNSTTVHTKAVGLTFHEGYPEVLLSLAPDFPGEEVTIEREPDNPYDTNAIAVLLSGSHIGHLSAVLAAELAPEMDADVPWRVDRAEVLIHPENVNHPGVYLLLTRL